MTYATNNGSFTDMAALPDSRASWQNSPTLSSGVPCAEASCKDVSRASSLAQATGCPKGFHHVSSRENSQPTCTTPWPTLRMCRRPPAFAIVLPTASLMTDSLPNSTIGSMLPCKNVVGTGPRPSALVSAVRFYLPSMSSCSGSNCTHLDGALLPQRGTCIRNVHCPVQPDHIGGAPTDRLQLPCPCRTTGRRMLNNMPALRHLMTLLSQPATHSQSSRHANAQRTVKHLR
jgi:hypothetical protein